MNLVNVVWNALVDQQRDPVAFLQSMRSYGRRLWWPAWGIRAGIWAALLTTLFIIAGVSSTNLKLLLAPVLLLPLIAQMLCSLPIIILGNAQFWLLYAYSPLLLFIAWLWALGELSPIGTWFGLQTGFVFYVGKLFADSCTLWVYQQVENARYEQQRRRDRFLPVVLLTPTAWLRARRMRLWSSFILVGIILYSYWALPARNLLGYRAFGEGVRVLHAVISVGMGVAACLGLDATLLAILRAIPPVRFTAGQWSATYAGRVALWTPVRYIRVIFSPERVLSEQSRIVCTLFTQGYLAPTIRQACRALSLQHIQQLLIALSIQEGGGAVIRYLHSALPSSLQATATFCANLADEATKPPDLQRWLHVLTTEFPLPMLQDNGLAASIMLILSQVRDALLTVKATPELTQTICRMRQLIVQMHAELLLSDMTQLISWPSMLLQHLEQHQKRFQTL